MRFFLFFRKKKELLTKNGNKEIQFKFDKQIKLAETSTPRSAAMYIKSQFCSFNREDVPNEIII